MAEWQTQQTQNLPGATSCEFESRHQHEQPCRQQGFEKQTRWHVDEDPHAIFLFSSCLLGLKKAVRLGIMKGIETGRLTAAEKGRSMAKKKSISCKEIQQKNKAYIDGIMPLEEAIAFVSHIRSCPECRAELNEFYGFYSALRSLDAREEEIGKFHLNIEKRLEETEAEAAKEKKEHYTRRIIFLIVALLAAAATGVSFGA